MKMKNSIKRTCLPALLLCGMLAAIGCGDAAEPMKPDNSADTASDTEAVTDAKPSDGLPETDMEGFSLNILHHDGIWLSWAKTVLDAEESSGDLLTDAIFNRNRDTEERFNCTINISEMENVSPTEIQALAMSGDNLYDVILMYDINITNSIPYLLPWENLPYIRLDKEWWNPEATAVFKIGDKTYSAASNFSLSVLSRAAGYEFNKTLLNNLDGGDIYQMVREGTWTHDAMFSLARLSTADINGDGTMDENDRYGIQGSWKETLNRLILGGGMTYVTRDENNYPVFSMPSDSNAIDKLIKIYEGISDMNVFHAEKTSVAENGSRGDFEKETALFLDSHPNTLEKHRQLDIDVGIVPCPKYDEAQDRYYAPSFGAEVPVLPITLQEVRFENVGMLMEALSFASQQEVVPTYKEVVLKTKAARDDDSSDMIDIIFSSITFDFGINAWQEQLSSRLIKSIYANRSGNVASSLEKMQKSVNKEIDKLIDAVENGAD